MYTASGKIISIEGTYGGQPFFRKDAIQPNEKRVAERLVQNPHPNIVHIYKVTDTYIDMEMLQPCIFSNMKELRMNADMRSVKDHLHIHNIMYIDWKYDNIGLSADGKYKLFDFDACGITNEANTEWIVNPPSYFNWKHALDKGFLDPVEIDDYCFQEYMYTNIKNTNSYAYEYIVPNYASTPNRMV